MRSEPRYSQIIRTVNERFDIEIRPSEAELLRTVEQLKTLIQAKLTDRGQARRWPDLQVANTLRSIIADKLNLWEEDIQPHHRFHIELACKDDPHPRDVG